mgnify:FL=1
MVGEFERSADAAKLAGQAQKRAVTAAFVVYEPPAILELKGEMASGDAAVTLEANIVHVGTANGYVGLFEAPGLPVVRTSDCRDSQSRLKRQRSRQGKTAWCSETATHGDCGPFRVPES